VGFLLDKPAILFGQIDFTTSLAACHGVMGLDASVWRI